MTMMTDAGVNMRFLFTVASKDIFSLIPDAVGFDKTF
jgi:hypothetical protein